MSSSQDDFVIPYHHASIPQQLQDGIRALQLDTYFWEGRVYMCHDTCELGAQPLAWAMDEVALFLTENPNNVILLSLYDDAGRPQIENVLERSGLLSEMFEYKEEEGYPTLRTLIDAQKRLFVYSNYSSTSGGGTYMKTHYHWVSTPYGASRVEDLSCTPLTGNVETATLFRINHYLSDPFAKQALAQEANKAEIIRRQLDTCTEETGRIPNQILVDFYQEGDLFKVVEEYNRQRFQ